MTKYLLVADVDQIQAYIFGTDRMRTIRGASALVAKLGEDICQKAGGQPGADGTCLRHQGGQLVFLTDKPEALAHLIREDAQEISGGSLSATIAWEPYLGDEVFSPMLSAVFNKIKALKESNLRGDNNSHNLLGGGFIRHCDLCKQYPATPNPENAAHLIWRPGNDPHEERHLCLACWKRKKGAEKMKFDEELGELIRNEQARFEHKVWSKDFKPDFPADLEQIWPNGQEGRLIGIVMADGDGIGQLLDKIQDPNLYHDFAQAIEQISLQAVARAICEIGYDLECMKSGQINLLPIIYGGDDFTFFLPAENALAFALAFGNAFADLSGREPTFTDDRNLPSIQTVLKASHPGQTHLTLSMGVAAAKPSFPFTALRSLAGELRQNAKRQRVARNSTEGMVDFVMITSASAEKLSTMRAHYARKDGGDEYSLTSWPYTLSNLGSLLNLSRQVLEIPRSQRKFLYAEFWHNRSAAESAYRSLVKKKNLAGVIDSIKALGSIRPDQTPFSGPKSDQTVLLDALEISELVKDGRIS